MCTFYSPMSFINFYLGFVLHRGYCLAYTYSIGEEAIWFHRYIRRENSEIDGRLATGRSQKIPKLTCRYPYVYPKLNLYFSTHWLFDSRIFLEGLIQFNHILVHCSVLVESCISGSLQQIVLSNPTRTFHLFLGLL